jgi:hypothetical protein
VIASDARNALLRPVLLASFSRRLLVERPTRTENVVVFICVQYSTEPWLPQVARKATCVRAGAMNFTSRILEGLMARRGLVEPREGGWLSLRFLLANLVLLYPLKRVFGADRVLVRLFLVPRIR